MGQSPSATLVYGVVLSETDEESSWLLKPAGVCEDDWEDDQTGCIEKIAEFDPWEPNRIGPAFEVYMAGTYGYRSKYLGYGVMASDWTASELSSDAMTVPPGADERIHAVLVKLGAPQEVLDKGASWWLLPFYG